MVSSKALAKGEQDTFSRMIFNTNIRQQQSVGMYHLVKLFQSGCVFYVVMLYSEICMVVWFSSRRNIIHFTFILVLFSNVHDFFFS